MGQPFYLWVSTQDRVRLTNHPKIKLEWMTDKKLNFYPLIEERETSELVRVVQSTLGEWQPEAISRAKSELQR